MPDREKVAEYLETCMRNRVISESFSEVIISLTKAEEIFALLKAQEPVPVKENKISKCECGETVCRYWHPKFCGFCGRKLLWY